MPCIHDAFDIPFWSLWDLMGIWGPSVCSGSGDLLGCLCFNTWADRIPYTARCLSQPRLHWPGGDWKPWKHTHWLSQSVADELWWIAWQQAQEKVPVRVRIYTVCFIETTVLWSVCVTISFLFATSASLWREVNQPVLSLQSSKNGSFYQQIWSTFARHGAVVYSCFLGLLATSLEHNCTDSMCCNVHIQKETVTVTVDSYL